MNLRPTWLLALVAIPAASQTTPPALRLGDNVVPTRYTAELKIVPGRDTFHGIIDIDVRIRQATPVIWLNATDLQIQSATVRAAGASHAARVLPGGDQFAGLQLDRPAGPGNAAIRIEYQGRISRTSSDGVFLNKVGSDLYVFTQFEPVSARRAFPCFDEPGFKVPWQLTLHVPRADRAFSNTPVQSETDGAGGTRTVRFEPTKPLPSYLVAFAVGPLEIVDAGRAGRNHIPVRVITPKGMAGEAVYAAKVSAEILTMLENYFGIPYPYTKLDNVALPLVYGFGAMENAGFITYAQNIILARPADETPRFRRSYASVAAHEMAHQWFGDLVTLEWWNDTWLNEAFATWMEQKIVGQWKPEWHLDVSDVNATQGAMQADSLVSARAVRQPIRSLGDIANAFDTITYEKGAGVIHMFEAWTGAEPFRKGVQLYLRRHAFGNATADQFLADVSAGSGKPIAAPFATFLDQPGVPLVTLGLQCANGGAASLSLAQKRFLPLGSPGAPAALWQIPVCAGYGWTGHTGRDCTLLTQPAGTASLSARQCPEWLIGNANELGYYHVHYQDDLMHRLVRNRGVRLATPERVGVLGDAQALARGGELAESDALQMAVELSQDSNRQVVERTMAIIAGIDEHLVPDDLRDVYQSLIRNTYGTRAHELGWNDKPGESDDVRMLRPALVGMVARRGDDRPLGEQAVQLARQWLKDHNAVSADTVSAVLDTAAQYGGPDLFDAYLAAAKAARNARDRRRLIAALGEFRDPALARRALDLTLSPDFDARETLVLLFEAQQYAETRSLAFDFVKQHFQELVARLPRGIGSDAGAMLPGVAAAFCSMDRYDEVKTFFEPRIQNFTGARRRLDQVLESIRICSAVKQAQEPSVVQFLREYQRTPGGPSSASDRQP